MAIQFFCTSCRQPIEVDHDVANQAVTCPYCRQITNVPGESDPAVALVAKAPPPPPPPSITGPSPTQPLAALNAPLPIPPLEEGNKLSWAAFACAMISLVSLIGFFIFLSSFAATLPPNPTHEQINEALKDRPIGPIMFSMFLLGGCVIPVVGIGLGIAALVKRMKPIWPAIVALVTYGGIVVLGCAGLLLAIATAAAAKKP
ncbi:MAG: hypothetical protein AABZ08_07530 [Planctomycetota bacterium]